MELKKFLTFLYKKIIFFRIISKIDLLKIILINEEVFLIIYTLSNEDFYYDKNKDFYFIIRIIFAGK